MFKLLAVAVVGLVAVLGYAATRPDAITVQRSLRINAPPETIFALIDDLHRWAVWSPYERKDPVMKKIYSGAATGVGAVYEWDGNDEVGQGRLEIMESLPPSKVAMTLDFVRPFEAHNIVVFTLRPDGDATHATWSLHAPSPYLTKLIGLFIDMDKMIGKDFEAGLASLKVVAER